MSEELEPGKHTLGMEFAREDAGEHGESLGTTTLYVDDQRCRRRGRCGRRSARSPSCGDGLCVGFDSGDNVSQQYSRPGTFTGGTILGVAVDVSDESYLDMEREAAGAFARD